MVAIAYDRPAYLQKGGNHGNEKNPGRMEQDLPRLQYRAQISGLIYRQESEEALGKRLHFA